MYKAQTLFNLIMISLLALTIAQVTEVNQVNAQIEIEWDYRYNGVGNDAAFDILATSDGGQVIAGYTKSNGFDFYIIKTDVEGTVEWEKIYGGSDGEQARSVIASNDGGYMVAGYTFSSDGDVGSNNGLYDYWVLKLDANGELIWEENYGGSDADICEDIIAVDGGYLLTGHAASIDFDITNPNDNFFHSAWVVKIDETGQILWDKSFGGGDTSVDGFCLIATPDGGFIMGSDVYVDGADGGDVSSSYGFMDIWVAKADSEGNIEWEQSYGGSDEDNISDIVLASDGGYIVSGYSNSSDGLVQVNNGSYDYWTFKIAANGDFIWGKVLGGSEEETAKDVVEGDDGYIWVIGGAGSSDGDVIGNDGSYDYWLVKLDPTDGGLVEQRALGGTLFDNGMCMSKTIDGGLVIGGICASNDGDVSNPNPTEGYDIWVVKVNVGEEEESAPPVANEWIDYSKTHYKFESDAEGLFRISYETLQQSGIDLTGANFKLIAEGKEMPIYTTTDGAFGTGDYIEFYGKPNDGSFDKSLYEIADDQAQPYKSMFSDFKTYYLVSDDSEPHLRLEDSVNSGPSGLPTEDYFMHKSLEVFDNTFHFGEPYLHQEYNGFIFPSVFDVGEGWVSSTVKDFTDDEPIGINTGIDFKVNSPYVYPSAIHPVNVNCRIVGRFQNTGVDENHHLEISVNENVYVDHFFHGFDVENLSFNISTSDIETESHPVTQEVETRFNFKGFDEIASETRYSIAYIELEYPRAFVFDDDAIFTLGLELDTDKYFEIDGFGGNGEIVMYDLTTNQRFVLTGNDDFYSFYLLADGNPYHNIVLASTLEDDIIDVPNLTSKTFIDYSQPANQGDYIIITNDVLREGPVDQITRYEDYRESLEGGEHNVVVVDVAELYDQFAQGIDKHPLAIKNFIDFAMDNWITAPQHLNLIGKAVRYDKTRYIDEIADQCLVPSYGYSASDLMFGVRDILTIESQLAIGRIPAKDDQQVRAYLDKLIEHETAQANDAPWLKNVLNIAKGWGAEQTNIFAAPLNSQVSTIEAADYEVVDTLRDERGAIPNDTTNWHDSSPEFAQWMNNGVAFINYIGHDSPQERYWQFDAQSPDTYNNEGKYPFILSYSFPSSDRMHLYYNDEACMAEDYVLADNRGAIAFFGAIRETEGVSNIQQEYLTALIENMYSVNPNLSIGQRIQVAINQVLNPDDVGMGIVIQNYSFAGDPALRFHNPPEEIACDLEVVESTNCNINENCEITFTVELDFSGIVAGQNIGITNNLTNETVYTTEGSYTSPEYENGSSYSYFVFLGDDANCNTTIASTGVACDFETLPQNCLGDVWPGDVNTDSIVNNVDVIYLGMQYGLTGAPRPVQDGINPTDWLAHPSIDWDNVQNNGANSKHADCNGNGAVELLDLNVIDLNYDLTHFGGKTEQEGLPLILQLPDTIGFGDTLEINIQLGTEIAMVEEFYGIAFTVNFDSEYIEEGSITFDFNSEFLGVEEQDVAGLGKVFYEEGKIEMGITKIDQVDEDGYGNIGKVSGVMIDDIIGKDGLVVPLTVGVSNITALGVNGKSIEIGAQTFETVIQSQGGGTSIGELNLVENEVNIYPNPARDILNINTQNIELTRVELFNTMGKLMIVENKEGFENGLNITQLPEGMYFLKVYSKQGAIIKKVQLFD